MGLFDSLFGSGGGSDRNAGMDALKDVPLPVLKEYYPELYKMVAELNPEMESVETLGPSEMAGIATDPALRQAQLKALGRLSEIGEAGGKDAQFMADMGGLTNDVNSMVAGQTGAIQQNLATRGMDGGMTELVQRNIAAQEGANRLSQQGLDLKAQAEQRALDALMKSGGMAGDMQAQDFNQAAQKAQAADAISKFNAANRQDVNARNTQAANSAQQYNVGAHQLTANQNTGVKNQAQQYNLGLPQQQFDNQIKKAGGIAGAYENSANAKDKDRDREAGLWGNLISGGFSAFGGSK